MLPLRTNRPRPLKQIDRSEERVLELERHDRCELIEGRKVVPINRLPGRAGILQVGVIEMQCHGLIADQPVDFVRVFADMNELGLSGEIGQRIRLPVSVEKNENVVGLHHPNRVVPKPVRLLYWKMTVSEPSSGMKGISMPPTASSMSSFPSPP